LVLGAKKGTNTIRRGGPRGKFYVELDLGKKIRGKEEGGSGREKSKEETREKRLTAPKIPVITVETEKKKSERGGGGKGKNATERSPRSSDRGGRNQNAWGGGEKKNVLGRPLDAGGKGTKKQRVKKRAPR